MLRLLGLHVIFKKSPQIKTVNEKRSLKTFNEVPTLKSVPFIGHSYLFLPGGGYKSERLTEAVYDLSKKLGPMFRLNLPGINLLITTDPEHTKILFRNEGKYPVRPPFPALVHYRKKAFGSIGVVPGNGEEWHKFRGGVTPLLQTNLIRTYFDRHKAVAKSFVEYIENNKDENDVLEDLFQHLLKFTIEAISVLSPGHRFNCLHDRNEETEEIINASIEFMDGLYSTLIGLPVWKVYRNSGYRKLERSHSTINRIIKKHIENLYLEYKNKSPSLLENHPFMFLLFNNSNLTLSDVTMLAMEVFLGGIDATATTLAFTLYYLARNEDVQNTARESLTDKNFTFLKACIRETLRLSPTSGGNARFLVHNTQFADYDIPAGTLVSAFFSVTSLEENYFINPLTYKPQRWLRNLGDEIHPFASLPFGHGPRICPGKRLAEQEIVILLQQILKRYKLKCVKEKDIGMVYRMNRIPDSPINIKFMNTNH